MNLVLDIDDFLIYSANLDEELIGDFETFLYEDEIIVCRPYLKAFLRYCFSRYQIYFSTRMPQERCDFILKNILDSNQKPLRVYTQEDCYENIPPYGSKELRKQAIEDEAVWVDDMPQYIDLSLNIRQEIIKAEEFDGDIVDSYLIDLIKLLETKRKAL